VVPLEGKAPSVGEDLSKNKFIKKEGIAVAGRAKGFPEEGKAMI